MFAQPAHLLLFVRRRESAWSWKAPHPKARWTTNKVVSYGCWCHPWKGWWSTKKIIRLCNQRWSSSKSGQKTWSNHTKGDETKGETFCSTASRAYTFQFLYNSYWFSILSRDIVIASMKTEMLVLRANQESLKQRLKRQEFRAQKFEGNDAAVQKPTGLPSHQVLHWIFNTLMWDVMMKGVWILWTSRMIVKMGPIQTAVNMAVAKLCPTILTNFSWPW